MLDIIDETYMTNQISEEQRSLNFEEYPPFYSYTNAMPRAAAAEKLFNEIFRI